MTLSKINLGNCIDWRSVRSAQRRESLPPAHTPPSARAPAYHVEESPLPRAQQLLAAKIVQGSQTALSEAACPAGNPPQVTYLDQGACQHFVRLKLRL